MAKKYKTKQKAFTETIAIYFKGGYLDFSYLSELKKNMYHWNLYEKAL